MGFSNGSRETPEDMVKRLAPKVALGVVGAIAALVVVFGSFYSVDAGHVGIVTRFGAVTRVAPPGLHVKFPLIEGLTEIATRTQTLEWGVDAQADRRMESYSRDQQPAHISVKVGYSVKQDDKSVLRLFNQYKDAAGFANAVIIPRTYEAVKSVFGTFDAQTVIQNREAFNAAVRQALNVLIPADGPILFESLQIQDISFSKAYENAVEERMKAQVEVAKVTQNLERERKEAEITVVQAKAKADAVRMAGNAEADAIRARSNALQSSPKLVELTIAEKWDGKLPTTMVPNAALPLLGVK